MLYADIFEREDELGAFYKEVGHSNKGSTGRQCLLILRVRN